MKRQKHSLSHYKLLTADMGKLVPIGLMEALPGDTFQQSSSMLLRMSPLVSPVMHPVSVRIHHWFVPHRLSYTGWEDFITGGPLGTGSAVPYPTNAAIVTPAVGSLHDYLGLPTSVAHPIGSISLLPQRAYNLIYNEYYRDEDLDTAALQDDAVVRNVCWEKDYFTAARPWSQKGPAVTLPLGVEATVKTKATETFTGAQAGLKIRDASGSLPAATQQLWAITSGQVQRASTGAPTSPVDVYPTNLYADLTTATAQDINQIRRAFALQRYQEARAQYGSRYTEYLRYIGVRPSDARMQKPEYLGGGKQTIAFSEVLRTGNVAADNATLPIGQLKGHGIAALRSNKYRFFCEEHGYIISLMSIRPKSIYANGLPKTFSKRTKEEYYQKELELIGQQPITNSEVFMSAVDATNKATFGYQDRYSEYRHQPSSVAGEFRTILDYWHLARKFGALPVLNAAFVDCDPGKRIFAEQTQNSCWIMVNHSVQARRMVGKTTVGRVL
ncbi:major capsid protein [Microviridae sp.]|nr:major capsid protein [Microviridae sp.]